MPVCRQTFCCIIIGIPALLEHAMSLQKCDNVSTLYTLNGSRPHDSLPLCLIDDFTPNTHATSTDSICGI